QGLQAPVKRHSSVRRMADILTAAETSALHAAAADAPGAKVLACTVARLYRGVGGDWHHEGTGAVLLVRAGAVSHIKLLNVDTRQAIFSQEVPQPAIGAASLSRTQLYND